jgi:predicted MPP superfamily phosphohydrolase
MVGTHSKGSRSIGIEQMQSSASIYLSGKDAFAAHTHCGQIRLPILGALWMPTEAPREATCGLYQDTKRLLWVTAGVGTSILPIRIGAQSEWDLLTLLEE